MMNRTDAIVIKIIGDGDEVFSDLVFAPRMSFLGVIFGVADLLERFAGETVIFFVRDFEGVFDGVFVGFFCVGEEVSFRLVVLVVVLVLIGVGVFVGVVVFGVGVGVGVLVGFVVGIGGAIKLMANGV